MGIFNNVGGDEEMELEDGVWSLMPPSRTSICRIEPMHHFLARAVLDQLRFGMAQIERLAEQFDGLAKARGRFGFHERAEFGGDFVHGIRAQAQGHALVRPHRVDGERKWRDFAVDGGPLEQQRLATSGRFHFAIGDFGDFKLGGDGL